MENSKDTAVEKRDTFLLIIRVLAVLFFLFYILTLGPKLIDEIREIINGAPVYRGWGMMVMELTFLIFLAGFIISWWRKCLGGLVIVLASFVQMLPFLIIEGNLGSLYFGVPLFVIGALFLIICLRAPR